MSTLEYIKTAFVFAGIAILLVAAGRSIVTTMRRMALREKARKILNRPNRVKEFDSFAAKSFLSQVTVEDICYDRYLRAAVDEMLGQLPLDRGAEPTNPSPEPIPVNQ